MQLETTNERNGERLDANFTNFREFKFRSREFAQFASNRFGACSYAFVLELNCCVLVR
jgi:hypothetical protein